MDNVLLLHFIYCLIGLSYTAYSQTFVRLFYHNMNNGTGWTIDRYATLGTAVASQYCGKGECVALPGDQTITYNGISTFGYHNIELIYTITPYGLDYQDWCRASYSVDGSNFQTLQEYDDDDNYKEMVETQYLGRDADNDAGGISIRFETIGGNSDYCFYDEVYVYGTDGTGDPTNNPTSNPTTETPSISPSVDLTIRPTNDPTTKNPTSNPTNLDPTTNPSQIPTSDPSFDPTNDPTDDPTDHPTLDPTNDPTKDLISQPTSDPTRNPTLNPTMEPMIHPTNDPSVQPSLAPTKRPTTPSPSAEFEAGTQTTTADTNSGKNGDSTTTTTELADRKTEDKQASLFSDDYLLTNWYYLAIIGVIFLCVLCTIFFCFFRESNSRKKAEEIERNLSSSQSKANHTIEMGKNTAAQSSLASTNATLTNIPTVPNSLHSLHSLSPSPQGSPQPVLASTPMGIMEYPSQPQPPPNTLVYQHDVQTMTPNGGMGASLLSNGTGETDADDLDLPHLKNEGDELYDQNDDDADELYNLDKKNTAGQFQTKDGGVTSGNAMMIVPQDSVDNPELQNGVDSATSVNEDMNAEYEYYYEDENGENRSENDGLYAHQPQDIPNTPQ